MDDLEDQYLNLIEEAIELSNQKRYMEAEKILIKVLPSAMMTGNIKEAVHSSNLLGCIYVIQGDLPNAAKSIKITMELGEGLRRTDPEIDGILLELEKQIAKIKEKNNTNSFFENSTQNGPTLTARGIRVPPQVASKGSESNNKDSKPNKNEACYIATMAYGDYYHPQVKILRKFRDDFLSNSILGRLFIKIYYKVSPKLVKALKNIDLVNLIIRKGLDCFIKMLKMFRKF